MSSETREIVFFYNGQKYDDMDALREQAKSDMCDHFCRYGSEVCAMTMDEEYGSMLDSVCAKCPLAVL